MKPRRSTARARATQIAFDALSIEGGLLSPEWLSKLAQLDAGMQSESEYRVLKGLNLRDEIGRYWRIAQALHRELKLGRDRKGDELALATRFATTLLREVFGFQSLAPSEALTREGRVYPVPYFAQGTRVPVVIAPVGAGLDTAFGIFGEGGRKRSAFGLLQEFLNSTDEALWGIACDGDTLRIARDNASLTRPAWIEADLARIFAEDRYADFAALWLLAHESRFGALDHPPSDCALEQWRNAGREEGTRARDKLRAGVQSALESFGMGFVSHPDNHALRSALQQGSLTAQALYQELLRLAYRLIFMLTAEERGVLHPPDAGALARARYEQGYSLRRLRERAVRRSAHDRHGDLWDALGVVFRGVARGEPRLALPALGGLFSPDRCPHLDAAKLSNAHLLLGIFKLSWLHDDAGITRVNWRDTGPEELGSVYESLLELVPQVDLTARRFVFATGDETKGNARKTSGSYYTPDSLVQVLLDSALEPVIAQTVAEHPSDPVEALLSLTVVDPACGSGHFLLAAARRLASHVARIASSGSPSAQEYRHALRRVVARCIYGVDLNPMALELCTVSLWMEAVEPGLPLTFLGSHLQHGNSLLGATPELMAKGIPDAAWEPIEGDDKKIASALKKKNKAERTGQQTFDTLWSAKATTVDASLLNAVEALDRSSDATLAAVSEKAAQWEAIQRSEAYVRQRFVADSWCAAFVWPKTEGEIENAPTHGVWSRLHAGQGRANARTVATVSSLARQYRFFHWHLIFPQVFQRGGFDVVLGNPPWERVKLQEQEFFAPRSGVIANALNAAARKRLIAALPKEDPHLWNEWVAASRRAEGESHAIRQSGRYPLCGKGDVNTYAIFAEHNRSLLGPGGRAGFIVPTGIATDDTTKQYFTNIVKQSSLRSLYDFQTGPDTFGNLAHGAMRFCLVTLASTPSSTAIDFFFHAKTPADLSVLDKHFSLSEIDFHLLSPNTRTCPTFSSRRDADLNLAIYRRAGTLWREADEAQGNPWGVRFMRMLDMANDSGLFQTRAELAKGKATLVGNRFVSDSETWVPLVEAKMIDHFDHRFASLVGVESGAGRASRKLVGWYSSRVEDPQDLSQPQYWVPEAEVRERLRDRWSRGWLLGWRDICRSTDQRTVIASLIPRVAVGHTTPLMFPAAGPTDTACLYACLCSFPLDYAARQKIGGTHVTYGYLKQLPVLAPPVYAGNTAWSPGTALRDWLLPRVLELTYTAWDLEPFAKDVGYAGAPFRWDAARRPLLRAELDAAFFHLYGIARDDVDYILETFPIVRRSDEKAHGEYRTKRLILEIYDELAIAARTGRAYVSRLDPPPADPRVAHPESTRPAWATKGAS